MKTFDEFFMEEKLDAEDREKIKEGGWKTTRKLIQKKLILLKSNIIYM